MSDNQVPVDGLDEAKRETLKTLAKAAWAVPVVATFSIGGLNVSSAWAQQVSNQTNQQSNS
jgi:hypothetical protein